MESTKRIGDFLISLDKPLGKGAFGSVYFGYKIQDPSIKIAAKVMSNAHIQNSPHRDKLIESIKREIAVLKKIPNSNIVHLHSEYLTNNNIYLIFEYCKDGDLLNYRESLGGPKAYLPEGEALEFFRHICNGFKALNLAKIIHRDIKPSNILLHEGHAKIADFGFARFTDDVDQKSFMTEVGSPLYMAPEIFNSNKYNAKCDVWSLGILLYELLYGMTPWMSNNAYDLFNNKIAKIPLKFPEFPKRSPKIKELLKGMLQINQDSRLSWEAIFKHDLVSESNYSLKELKKSTIIDESLTQSMNQSSKSGKKLVQGALNAVNEQKEISFTDDMIDEKNEKNEKNNKQIEDTSPSSIKKNNDLKIRPDPYETKKLIKKIKDLMLYERNLAFFLKGSCHLMVSNFGNGFLHIDELFLYKLVFILQKYEMILMKYSLDLTEGKIHLEKVSTAEFFASNEYPVFLKQIKSDYEECNQIYQQVLNLLKSKMLILKKQENIGEFLQILQNGLICDQIFCKVYKEILQEFMDSISLEFFSMVEQNKPEDVEMEYIKMVRFLQMAATVDKPFSYFKKKEGEESCHLFFQFYDDIAQIDGKDLILLVKKNWIK